MSPARVRSSELCLPLGTQQTIEAPERDPGCVLTDLSFQGVTLAPQESQVEESTAGTGFQSDCTVGLAATYRKEKKGKRSRGVGGPLLVLPPHPRRTDPAGLWAEQVGRQLGLLLNPSCSLSLCPSSALGGHTGNVQRDMADNLEYVFRRLGPQLPPRATERD